MSENQVVGCNPPDWKSIAMFEVNFDESYDGTGDVVWSIAGWVAHESNWEFFNRRWREVLYDYSASCFHGSGCDGPHEEFKNWSECKRDNFRYSLIDVIESADLTGISCAINVREAPHIAARPDPYYYCMEYCIVEALRKTPPGEKLRIVFGEHDNAKGKPKEILDSLVACKDFDERDRISSEPPKSGISKDIPGIQGADMLAYETYRYARSKMDGSKVRGFYSRLEKLTPTSQFFNGHDIMMLINERSYLK